MQRPPQLKMHPSNKRRLERLISSRSKAQDRHTKRRRVELKRIYRKSAGAKARLRPNCLIQIRQGKPQSNRANYKCLTQRRCLILFSSSRLFPKSNDSLSTKQLSIRLRVMFCGRNLWRGSLAIKLSHTLDRLSALCKCIHRQVSKVPNRDILRVLTPRVSRRVARAYRHQICFNLN